MQGFSTIHEARRFATANGIQYVHEHEGLWFPCKDHGECALHFGGHEHHHDDAVIEEVEHEHEHEEHPHNESVSEDIEDIEDIREDIEETEEELEELHDKLEDELQNLGHRFNQNID